jgi:hypothetical protein
MAEEVEQTAAANAEAAAAPDLRVQVAAEGKSAVG